MKTGLVNIGKVLNAGKINYNIILLGSIMGYLQNNKKPNFA